jgi:hypothetical protein
MEAEANAAAADLEADFGSGPPAPLDIDTAPPDHDAVEAAPAHHDAAAGPGTDSDHVAPEMPDGA